MIEVGEYVRSLINGNIYKVIEISDLLKEPGIKYYKFDEFRGMCSTEEYNVKHSKNIIDLIKEKDILKYKLNNLSSYKIAEVRKYKDARSFKEYLGVEGFGLEQIKILDVLTKEQYSQNCYKVVGGEDEL